MATSINPAKRLLLPRDNRSRTSWDEQQQYTGKDIVPLAGKTRQEKWNELYTDG